MQEVELFPVRARSGNLSRISGEAHALTKYLISLAQSRFDLYGVGFSKFDGLTEEY